MHDGFIRPHRLQAVQGKDLPPVVCTRPIERRYPALALHRRPAVGKPELGTPVTVVLHEGKILATGDQTGRDTIRPQQYEVARALVIEGEVVLGMADRDDAA